MEAPRNEIRTSKARARLCEERGDRHVSVIRGGETGPNEMARRCVHVCVCMYVYISCFLPVVVGETRRYLDNQPQAVCWLIQVSLNPDSLNQTETTKNSKYMESLFAVLCPSLPAS